MQNDALLVNITGETVLLGPFERGQIPLYTRWFNNLETLHTPGELALAPGSIESTTNWYESYVLGRSDVAWFTVYARSSRQAIGYAELKDIDHQSRSAELAVMLDEESAGGKDYRADVASLMLDYAFTALDLHNIELACYEFDVAGMRAFQQAGFCEFARRRESRYMGGKFWDTIFMQCLSTGFASPVLHEIFRPDEPRQS